jgi:hypothetical protein
MAPVRYPPVIKKIMNWDITLLRLISCSIRNGFGLRVEITVAIKEKTKLTVNTTLKYGRYFLIICRGSIFKFITGPSLRFHQYHRYLSSH